MKATCPCWCTVLAVTFFSVAARCETNAQTEFSVSNPQDYIREQSQIFTNQAGAGAETFYLLARLQNRLGHQDEAERLGRQALRYDITRADIHSFLGKIYTVEGRFEDATNSFRKSLLFDQKNGNTYRLLGLVLDQAGDHEGAVNAISKSVEINPSDAAAQLVLGRLLLNSGNAKDAVGHLRIACQLDATSVNSFYVLYQAQTQVGETNAAAETLKTFQRLRNGERDELVAHDKAYDDQNTLRNTAAGFHTDAAELFFAQGKDNLAQEQLKEAMRVAPGDDKAYEMQAARYIKAGAFPLAREVYENMGRAQTNRPTSHVLLGAVLIKMKDYPGAISEFKKALEIDPNQPEALKDLVVIYVAERSNLPEALDLSRRLLKLQPAAANYDLVAQTAYLNGNIEEARTASNEALRIEPANLAYIEHHRRFTRKQ